jgi:hypothetical protein
MKFRTIDIEGDGLYRSLNQKLFPEGNHFDPGTIIWCVTFCDQDYSTLTLVKKLPETPRHVKDGVYTKAVHYRDSVVPKEIDGHVIKEFTDTKEFIKEIFWQIMISSGNLYAKGYKEYNYDAMLLKSYFDRHGFHGDIAVNWVKTVEPTVWEETPKQVKTGQWVSNQDYMVTGIRHNIQDTLQLAQRINNHEVKDMRIYMS